MLNDIRLYSSRYELWSTASGETLFYKEYINMELSRLADLEGTTIDMPETEISTSILIDDSEGLIPEWLKNA